MIQSIFDHNRAYAIGDHVTPSNQSLVGGDHPRHGQVYIVDEIWHADNIYFSTVIATHEQDGTPVYLAAMDWSLFINREKTHEEIYMDGITEMEALIVEARANGMGQDWWNRFTAVSLKHFPISPDRHTHGANRETFQTELAKVKGERVNHKLVRGVDVWKTAPTFAVPPLVVAQLLIVDTCRIVRERINKDAFGDAYGWML